MTQRRLLYLLAALLIAKFILEPLLVWQTQSVDALNAANRQLDKFYGVISSEADYQLALIDVRSKLDIVNKRLYQNTDSVKLNVQRDLEGLFVTKGGLKVTGFNWVVGSSESPNSVGVLRAVVYFSGSLPSMIEVFWALGASPKVVKIVDWRQQVKSYGEDDLGAVSGNVTIEVFVSSSQPMANIGGINNADGQ